MFGCIEDKEFVFERVEGGVDKFGFGGFGGGEVGRVGGCGGDGLEQVFVPLVEAARELEEGVDEDAIEEGFEECAFDGDEVEPALEAFWQALPEEKAGALVGSAIEGSDLVVGVKGGRDFEELVRAQECVAKEVDLGEGDPSEADLDQHKPELNDGGVCKGVFGVGLDLTKERAEDNADRAENDQEGKDAGGGLEQGKHAKQQEDAKVCGERAIEDSAGGSGAFHRTR